MVNIERNPSRLVLEKEIEFYERNRDELANKYPGRYLLIYGDDLIGDYATMSDATTEGVRRFGSEPVLVRLAGADATSIYTTTIF